MKFVQVTEGTVAVAVTAVAGEVGVTVAEVTRAEALRRDL